MEGPPYGKRINELCLNGMGGYDAPHFGPFLLLFLAWQAGLSHPQNPLPIEYSPSTAFTIWFFFFPFIIFITILFKPLLS